MLNQGNIDSQYHVAYVENYLDCVENLPNDLQRHITRMRELDACYQGLQNELRILHETIYNGKLSVDTPANRKSLLSFKRTLIAVQELSDEKLNIVQQIQDCIENRTRQLEIDFKNLCTFSAVGKESEKCENTKELIPVCERPTKRARRNARSDSHGADSEVDKTPDVKPVTTRKGAGKKKRRKGRMEKDRGTSPEDIPIDPNEPTYCLCEQVSFGEMICCDNDLCPIEWFHFSCVSLTCKPKGKWYCPRCRGDRPTVMKPKALFLKELEKYNKEREERIHDK